MVVLSIDIRKENLYDDGFNLVRDHLLWIFDTLSEWGSNINSRYYSGKRILINIDIPIMAPVIPNTISGFIFIPLVSSSKNLNNPALEAGKGAFFFLVITDQKVVIRL